MQQLKRIRKVAQRVYGRGMGLLIGIFVIQAMSACAQTVEEKLSALESRLNQLERQIGALQVPVGGMGQHIVARNLVGIDCSSNPKPTGFGTAELYFPYIEGIPEQFLFRAGATVQNETTAVITAVFSRIEVSQTTNGGMTNVFLKPHEILYYYHPNSSPRSWDDFDGFQAGQLIAVYRVQKNMFSVVPQGVSYVVNSGPLIYSADFVLPDGSVANLANFMPGGITVYVVGTLGSFITNADGTPHVIDLTNSQGPLKLGSCALTSPFSGSGTNPGPGPAGVTTFRQHDANEQ